MVDLNLPALLGEHAPTPDIARLWLVWIALQCLGGRNATRNQSDPAFLLGMGLDAPPNDLWTDLQPPEALLPAFREHLRAARYVTGTHLALSEIDGGTLIHDMRADYWLALTPDPDTALLQLAQTLEPAQSLWHSGDSAPGGEPGATFARFYHPPQADVDYFRLPRLSDDLNRALMPLSQAVLRNFARRQMGFGWSSPSYIQTNFLGSAGQITLHPRRIDVLLSDVPLSAVLRMTGLHRDEYPYPWDETTSVRLLLP